MLAETILNNYIDTMIGELKEESKKIINYSNDFKQTRKEIFAHVAKITTSRSKSMLDTLIGELSNKTLSSIKFKDSPQWRNKFYDLRLESKLHEKYKFDIPHLKSSEVERIFKSLAASAGFATIDAILIYALSPENLAVPIALTVVGAFAAFLLAYMLQGGEKNKLRRFHDEMQIYFNDLRTALIKWFIEIEKYFMQCVDELVI